MEALALRCPECGVTLALAESLNGCVIDAVHPRPASVDSIQIPGFGGGVAGAVETIRNWARNCHDPFGP